MLADQRKALETNSSNPDDNCCLSPDTFDSFPEVIAVSSYRREFAKIMVSAPDVNIFILGAADDEGVVMAVRQFVFGFFWTVKALVYDQETFTRLEMFSVMGSLPHLKLALIWLLLLT